MSDQEIVIAALRKLRRCTVVSHYNPDADAYGSALGLALSLRSLGIEVMVVNESPTTDEFSFLPGIKEIGHELLWFDAPLVALDCGDRKRVGDRFVPLLSRFPEVINIDHHISNDRFGTLNLVDPKASSTAEIVYRLVSSLLPSVPRDAAVCLYAGICADTGFFRYESTSPATFEAAAALLRCGVPGAMVAECLSGNAPRSAAVLRATAILGAEFLVRDTLAVSVLRAHDFSRCGATIDDGEGIVEMLRDIRGVQIAVSIREHEGIWRTSLRSRAGGPEVHTIAAQFGGGGHARAAGFRWRGSLEELTPAIIGACSRVLG